MPNEVRWTVWAVSGVFILTLAIAAMTIIVGEPWTISVLIPGWLCMIGWAYNYWRLWRFMKQRAAPAKEARGAGQSAAS